MPTIQYEGGAGYVARLDGHVPALQSFDLEYTNGDHHVGRLSVGALTSDGTRPDFDSFLLELNDLDYGPLGTEHSDPARKRAGYLDVAPFGARRRVVSGGGLSGVARLDVPPLPASRLALLSGFRFQTEAGNHHLRRLRVWPEEELGRVTVGFHDDSAGDDRYGGAWVWAEVERAPVVPGSATFVGPFERRFTFTGSTRVSRRTGVAVLHGFSFEFLDGDHHLQRVALDLASSDREIAATFVDGEGTHAVRATVRYVLYRQ